MPRTGEWFLDFILSYIPMIKFINENKNSAGNFNSITINWVKFYFSYETCIAVVLRDLFSNKIEYCIKNFRWPTTGKHLNRFWVDKKDRLSRDDFDTVLREAYRQVWLVNNQ